jgi:hypothetical protein
MAFLLGPALGALSSFLFKKKGGKIVQQTTNGQAFMQAKPVALKLGGNVFSTMPKPIRKKTGGRIKKRKQKK